MRLRRMTRWTGAPWTVEVQKYCQVWRLETRCRFVLCELQAILILARGD